MKKIVLELEFIAGEIIERFIEDRAEYDIEREEAIVCLKETVLEENIDLNNETTSYDINGDIDEIIKKYFGLNKEDDGHEDICDEIYEFTQNIIREKVYQM